MFVMRPINENDLDAYDAFAKKASLGLINLPKNREALKEKIKESQRAFNTPIEEPDRENYIFALENIITGELGGTCGICSSMGVKEPNYYFQITSIKNKQTQNDMQVLNLVNYRKGPSEVLALYLKAEFRKEGLGKLLSLSRFLFMANHRKRFKDYTVAEMRGYIKEDDTVPFWESIGRKFLDISYTELCEMERSGHAFIPNILPQWPLYVALLPQEAQEHLAKTHDKTLPALKMLYKEGFTFTGEIDPFDGGPKIGCKTEEIATIKNSQTAIVDSIDQTIDNSRAYLLSNTNIDFRACYGNVYSVNKGLVSISADIAKALKVGLGDEIRFVKLEYSNIGK